ncbi:MAG: hypothetical protein WB821_07110, partial [Burkholderiaceae bacterium]
MRLVHFTKNSCAVALAAVLAVGCAQLPSAPTAAATGASATAGKTELLWFSQAGFRIKSPGGKM